jgi:deoxycytidylate deaminase
MKDTAYPYLPSGRTILYVAAENPFMQAARAYSLEHSLDDAVKTGSSIVKNNMIIGLGANGSEYHKTQVCERVRQSAPTGTGYELCEGCHPKNHSEPRAIENARERGFVTEGADLYLWGHWWACEPCWKAIIDAGIVNVYLLEGSERLFNKNHPDNILSHW